MKKAKKLSVVVSVYNEEAVLDTFHGAITPILEELPVEYELLYINDGSTDATESILNKLTAEQPEYKAIHFSRNFGHEAAMIAGIDYADGDYIVCMDVDMQHPPSALVSMVQAFEEGNEIVLMVRESNKDAGLFKNITSSLFYGILNWLGNDKFVKNVSDFFGMSSNVAELFRREYREKRRYLRGYIQHVGFQKKILHYVAAPRCAGKSKYSVKRLVNVFVIAIVNFSKNLVRTGFYFALLALAVAIAFGCYALVYHAKYQVWSAIAVISCVVGFFFSLQFLLMGIMGEYIGAILSETNRRPIYIVKDTRHIER